MPLSEYRSSTVSAVSKYGLGWSVWIGSEYGFVTLLDESASESHTLAICAKAFRPPPNHPKPPQTPNFPENPALPRNPPGIPTEFILSAIQNPTEFH